MIHIFFISKKDVLYFSLIWGTTALVFLSIVLPFIFTLSIFNFIWGFLGSIIIGFFVWIWFGTGYRVESNTVKIQTGPFKQTIGIQDIKNIIKKKSVWSAAALATDRLVIRYGKYDWDVLVSPKKEYEFIKLLLSKNPKIQIDEGLSKLYKL